MRILICLLFLGVSVSASLREKRQATYTFPGPRNDGAGRHAQQAYRQGSQGRAVSRNYDEDDDPELYQAPRRQYQPQSQPQYVQEARPQAPQQAPVYEAPRSAAPPAQSRQSYTAPAATQRKKASASNRASKYGGSAPQQSLNGGGAADEIIEEGPDPLTLLLEDSKFTCGGKTDGYYADDSVNCHVFHYCVGGARHSWMCPEGTLFHQVHLNCVPEGQDICAQSEKFHFVNDYLYKPVDYDGPNNTARYAQRYYPDGYVVGDAFQTHNQGPRPAPQPAPPAQPSYRAQSYPAPAQRPASRPQHRQVAPPPPPPPPTYASQPQSASYGSQAGAQPHAGYRAQQQQQQQQQQQAPRASRPSRPTYVTEVQQGYRGNPVTPIPHSEPVSDELYQPEPETRRQATPSRSSAGYAPHQGQRQQPPPSPQQPRYRSAGNPRAVARAQYPSYASNQAAGVQYDEDY